MEYTELPSEGFAALAGTAKPRSEKKIPEFMKSFGWCTWDAFYSQVSAQGNTTLDCLSLHPLYLAAWNVLKMMPREHRKSHEVILCEHMPNTGISTECDCLWQALRMGWVH